jgi:hypothetical protein
MQLRRGEDIKGRRPMANAFRCCASALALVIVSLIAPASAQFPPVPSQQEAPPAAAPPGAKPPPPLGPAIAGKWSGQLTALGASTVVNFELAVTAGGGETKYPDLDCMGKLRRIGSSKTYVFFVEVISKGRADKGGRCQDGSVTISRQGENLALVWFGSIQEGLILAYGTLSKK